MKFDKEYAYGDSHEEFKKVAVAATSQSELIVAEVPIQGFCVYMLSVLLITDFVSLYQFIVTFSKNKCYRIFLYTCELSSVTFMLCILNALDDFICLLVEMMSHPGVLCCIIFI